MLTPSSLGGLRVANVGSTTPWINLAVYADSGVGKTTLLGSSCKVPEMCPVIHVDCEGGTLSLVQNYPEVETVRVKNTKELQSVYDELHNGNHPYKTVLVDSGTEVQQMSMSDIQEASLLADPDHDPDVFEHWKEWGRTLNQMRKIVRGFRDLDMHTIISALTIEKQDNTGARKIQPKFYGQFLQEFPALPDVVLYYYLKDVEETGETKRIICSQKTEKVVAKDRTNSLPQFMEDPTMEKIFPLLLEGFKKLPDLKGEERDKLATAEEQQEPVNI